MQNSITKVAMAALIGLGSISFAPVPVHAQDLELEIGREGPRIRLRDECDPGREYCGEPNRRERREERRSCTEGRALDKADRMGIRRARIVSAGRRVIEVGGRDEYGDRVVISFGRAPNCPVLD